MLKCLICGKKFKHLGAHLVKKHHILAREYKMKFGFDLNKPLITKDISELKRRQVFENGTINNLKKGGKYRFKKGGVYRKYFSKESIDRLIKMNKTPRTYSHICKKCGKRFTSHCKRSLFCCSSCKRRYYYAQKRNFQVREYNPSHDAKPTKKK